MKQKNVTPQLLQKAESDHFIRSYIRDMQSEIYKLAVPDFFVGMSFRKFSQVLYLYNVNLDVSNLDDSKLI